MPQAVIHTRTVSVGTDYTALDFEANHVLTILAVGVDVYIACGVHAAHAVTDARATRLPDGAAVEFKPAPRGTVYIRASSPGDVSMWYS